MNAILDEEDMEMTCPDDDTTIHKLTKADLASVGEIKREQASSILNLYLQLQKLRVGASNRVSAHERRVDILADPEFLIHLKAQTHKVERQAMKGLQAFAESQPLGRWALSIPGIGPFVAASLLADIDVAKAHTAGSIWRFAGLDPTIQWGKGQKRPYNARLKRCCWWLGESFKRLSKRSDSIYCRLYVQRKEYEQKRNEAGELAEFAAKRIEKAKASRWGMTEPQKTAWEAGKLQAAGLDLRAMRYAVKLFLSHYHQVGREMLGLPVPTPWAIQFGGHAHMIPPPNWPFE